MAAPVSTPPTPPTPPAGVPAPAGVAPPVVPTPPVATGLVAPAPPPRFEQPNAPIPSAVGRRASPVVWLEVLLVVAAFAVVSSGLVVVGLRTARPSETAAPGAAAMTARPERTGVPGAAPAILAKFDQMLGDGSAIRSGAAYTIEVEAANRATATTERIWMVIEWRPEDRVPSPRASGRFLACAPTDCQSADLDAGGRTEISWPGLGPSEHHVFRATVVVDGLEPGSTFQYRVSTGSGASAESMDGGLTWDLDLDVQ